MTDWGLVEVIAGELKRTIRCGAKPNQIFLCHELKKIAKAYSPDTDRAGLELAIIALLKETAKSMPDPEGKAVVILLELSGSAYVRLTAVERRKRALEVLEYPCGLETFRRPDGPEMALMRQFAEVLVERLA